MSHPVAPDPDYLAQLARDFEDEHVLQNLDQCGGVERSARAMSHPARSAGVSAPVETAWNVEALAPVVSRPRA